MELFDICNEHGEPTGEVVTREKAHELGILHRTVHIWIIRKNKPIVFVLLQKRAQGKDSFPGCYDTSCAGHVEAGAEPIDAALRELKEELGIAAQPEHLQFIGTFRIQYETEFYGKPFRDNEVAFTYIYEEPIEVESLLLQEEEVESVTWLGADTLYLSITEKKPEYCVPSGGINLVRKHYYPHCTNTAVRQAKKKIDHILRKYGQNCQIVFLRRIAIILDSYKVSSTADRKAISRIMIESGVTNRTIEDLSAEWEVHNVAYKLGLFRKHAKDVDLDYDQDPRFFVRFATKIFDKILHKY